MSWYKLRQTDWSVCHVFLLLLGWNVKDNKIKKILCEMYVWKLIYSIKY